MSQGTPNSSDLVNFRIVSEEEYRANVKRAEEAQAQLDHFKAINEAAKKAYDQQQELLRKIQEGKEAERQLQALAGTSGSRTPALAGSSGQTNLPTAQHRHPPYMQQYTQQIYGTSYQTIQTGNQPSGSSYSQQNGDAMKFTHYRPAWQPQTSQPVNPRNHVQPQQNSASQPSSITSRPSVRQQVPVQQGRQALSMQPVVSASQLNQVQSVSHSVPASFNMSVQQQNHQQQNHLQTQSGQVPAVPNFVTSSRVQQYQIPPPSGSTYGTSDASKMKTFNPQLSTSIPLPNVSAKPDGTELGATVANVQAQLVNRTPSHSNPVHVAPSIDSSNQTEPSVDDKTLLWQRFSQSIVGWARTATPSSEMPLINTNIKVVKDANSQVFVAIPGTDGQKPITMTLQTLVASLKVEKPSPPDQEITAEPPNKPDAPDSRNGYRPYSVPQHQALQASASSGALSMSRNNLENITSSAFKAPLTPTESSAVSSSSQRTPSQANKKSLAKDILRALGFSSLKRSQPDDASVSQALEPPAKRRASGMTSQTSDGADVMLRASIKNVERFPQTADTYPQQAVKPDQAKLTSDGSESPVSSTMSSESALPQSSNSHLMIVPDTSKLHASPIEKTFIAPTAQEVPQSLPSNNDDNRSVNENLFPERPTTPLFLPSLSSSPIAGPSHELRTDLNRNAVRHARGSTQSFYIIVPPAPFWIKQQKAQHLRKKRRLASESERESSNRGISGISSDKETSLGRHQRAEGDGIEDEDNDVIDLDPANNLATDELEREAILLSCSRMREQPCRWNNCNVVLNSAEKLIRHLAYAHQEIFEEFSVCRWQHCGRPAVNWAKLFRHLKGHVLLPLRCAYQNCQESFRTPRQLAKHHRNVHRNNSPKPSDTPFAPTLKTPPPASPLILPSYLMEPIQRPSMTKERHGSLGPWVLRQIAGPVNHEVKRYNAASKLLQSPSRSNQQSYQQYDFLSFPSTNYSSAPSLPSKIRGMEDLISGEVSDMVQDGLVLWGLQKEEEDELSLPSSPLLQTSPREKATTEEQLEVDSVQIMLEN